MKTKFSHTLVQLNKSNIHPYNNDEIFDYYTNVSFTVKYNKLKIYKKTPRNNITLRKYLKLLNIDFKISLIQIKELKKLINMINIYNIYVSKKTIYSLLKHNIKTNYYNRVRLSACLQSQDCKAYFIILYGYVKGMHIWKNKKSNKMKGSNNPAYNHNGKYSALSVNFVQYNGLTDNEKLTKISDLHSKMNTSRVNGKPSSNKIEFWTNKGLSEEDANILLSERQSTFSLEKCIEKHGNEKGLFVFNERQKNWQETLNSKSDKEIKLINSSKSSSLDMCIKRYGLEVGTLFHNNINKKKSETLISLNKEKRLRLNIFEDDSKKYSKLVRRLTEKEYKEKEHIINNKNNLRSRTDYHLDHKLSIYNAFIENIPSYITSNYFNLEMIYYSDNLSKGINSSITVEELMKGYYKC